MIFLWRTGSWRNWESTFLSGLSPPRIVLRSSSKRDAFIYNEEYDIYICPNGKQLRPKRLYRSNSGLFWEYWADRAECGYCPLREKCLGERAWHGARRLLDSYFKPSVQRGRARQQGSEYRQALKARQVWCEGTFAIQKRCHMSWCWGRIPW